MLAVIFSSSDGSGDFPHVNVPVPKKQKQTRSSSSKGPSHKASSSQQAVPSTTDIAKPGKAIFEIELCIGDGRKCWLCGYKDDAPDHVKITIHMKWGAPVKNGKNVGNYCFYCVRVFEARYRYKPDIEAIGDVVTLIGDNAEENRRFMNFWKASVTYFQKVGCHKGRPQWAQAVDALARMGAHTHG